MISDKVERTKASKNSGRKGGLLLALTWLSAMSALATPPPKGVAPVLIPAGGFAIDGDLMGVSSGAGDWLGGTNAASGVLTAAGAAINPLTTFHFADPFNTTADNIFNGGLKWTDNPNAWGWTSSKASSKTDINNVLMHVGKDAQDHTWTVVAADRASTSGDSYIDFEFAQNTLVKNSNGTFTSSGPHGGRTVNDLLLSLAFTSGGSVADFLAYRWVPNGSGGYAYVDVTASLPAGRVFVALNTNNISVPYGAFGLTTYSANAFVEAALDLTALLSGFDPCLSLGFKTIMVKTKSSASDTASISDFMDPIQYSLQIGPSANAGPDQARCTQGDSTEFPLQGRATAGMKPIISTTWSVVSGSAVIDSPSSLITTAHVSSATATLRLTAIQEDGCTETDDIVLSVANYPACSITGATATCPASTNIFQAPTGMSAYAWTITGNGTISGATNGQTVKVISGGNCGATYTVNLLTTAGICSSACSTDVLVGDTTPPSLIIPGDRVLDCPATTTTNVTGAATAQDGCGKVTVSYSDSVTPTCGGARIIARTWTATDYCGNSTNAVQTITVRDIAAPTLTLPPDRTLDCPANTNASNTGIATATDACSTVTVSFSDSVSNNCGGAVVIKRLWTAADACGNAATGVQTITVRDISAPSLIVPPNLTLECPADTSTNSTGIATSTDGCGTVTVTYSDSVSNSCGGSQVIKRTWVATDSCGNTTNRLQTITLRDTTRPNLTLPPNVTLECPGNISTTNTGVATAVDACSSASVSFSDVVTTNCGGTRVVARTWSAVDSCGNATNGVQTITVRDSTPPTLTVPANLTLECPANTSTNNTGVATAQDGCGAVTITFSDAITTNCGNTKVFARTWTARDTCGNVSSAVQTITVRDSTAPTLTLPPNLTLECPANTNTSNTGVATATDGCGSVTVSFLDVVTNNCGGTRVIARNWKAVDSCGNIANGTQLITVRDSTRPTLTLPPNLTLECPANTNASNTGVATSQDGCGTVTVTFSDSVSNACGGTKVISRLWSAVDDCGNATNGMQTITVRDTLRPTLTVPPSVVLECPANTSTNANGAATAQDGCGAVTVSYADVVTTNCGNTKVLARTWTAVDACGNATNAVQTITVRDSIAPTLTLPPNLTLECPANTNITSTGTATATDGCGAVNVTFTDSVSNACGNTKVILRAWKATDACGNIANGVQTITVRDTIAPSLLIPTNVVLECPATDTRTNATGAATATDGCGTVTISYNDVVTTNCGQTKVIARTWTALDQCGNSTNGVQTITVRDTVKPSLTIPANVVLQCPANTSTTNTGIATASDGCSTVAVTYSDSVSNTCGGAKVISRQWTATDACGNSTNKVQQITVIDTVPPTITAPPSLVLECPASTTTNATGMATAQDGCGAVNISYSDVVTNYCGGTKMITRTWTATDGCGNAVSAVQTITLRDMTPPSLKLPANVVQQCPGDTRTSATGVAISTDGCGVVTITYSDVVSNGSCGFTKTVQRLWTAVDQCGNTTNGLQTITVIDTTRPTVVFPNTPVQCVGDIPPPYTNMAAFLAAGGTATDNCSSALTFAFVSDSGLVGRCPGTVTRVYRFTDECGNYTDATNRITVDDTIAPVMVCSTNAIVEYGITNITPPTATDNCSTNVVITYSDSVLQSQYNMNFLVADPDLNTGPYGPTYLHLGPASLPCPDAARLTGRALDPLRNAVAYSPNGQQDALTSIGNVPMCFGQIVPFEMVIEASGGPGPERGTVEFSCDWHTYTTSNNRFGYDTNYMVYCAFVDAADPGSIDPNANARVVSYSSVVVNRGTAEEAIRGTFRVTGIDSGDRVVVEIWVVLDPDMPDHSGGTISAEMVSAQVASVPPRPISIGTQTDSLGNLGKIFALPPPQQQPPLGPLPPQPPALPGQTISVINRTWTATDDCGNQSSCGQQITVRDTSAPVLYLPPDLVLECPASDTSTNNTGVATAIDLASAFRISYSDSVSNGCAGTKVVSRLWTATDDAGNTTNRVQTIIVQDSKAPSLSIPADVVLECPNNNTSTNYTGGATAQDGCGTASVSYSDIVTANCGGTKIIARTWTAIDTCGNITNAVQTITVRDSIAPTLIVPPNVVLECPTTTATNITGVATATDGCGSVLISYNDTLTTNSGGFTISRLWTATDSCGNSTNTVQTIAVKDTTGPSVTAKVVNTLGQAGQMATLVQNKFATVFPNGLSIGIYAPSNGTAAPNGLFWDANAIGIPSLVSLLGQVPATPGGPLTADIQDALTTVGGGDLALQTIILSLNIGFNNAGVLGIAPNNFGSLIYTNAGDSLNGLPVGKIVDSANRALAGLGLPLGHSFASLASVLASLNVAFPNTTISPWAAAHLSSPSVVVQCTGDVPVARANSIITSDSCGGPVTVAPPTDTILSYSNASSYTLLRTWVAQDQAGNTTTCSYQVVVKDTTPPAMTISPAIQNVRLIDTWSFTTPSATDNCGPVTVNVLNTTTNLTATNTMLVSRTWVALDVAGNTNTCSQMVVVSLALPPTIKAPPVGQTFGYGDGGSLSVVADGTGPFTYQWRYNGTNIAGATGSSLNLSGIQITNAGLYTVVVTGPGGSVTSRVAVVNVYPRLTGQRQGTSLVLTWPAGFILQSASKVTGPYTDVAGAVSPYSTPMTAPQKYFRLRSQPAVLSLRLTGGHSTIDMTGSPGENFVLRASTDLVNWVNLTTNTLPMTYIDSDTGTLPKRFYRAVLAH